MFGKFSETPGVFSSSKEFNDAVDEYRKVVAARFKLQVEDVGLSE